MNKYTELKDKHQKEVNEFPMQFAFSNEQFKEGMEQLGLTEKDTDKVYSFGNTGGFYRRSDAKRLHEMLDRQEQERKEAMKNDQYIYEMFDYELANHEYIITRSTRETLDALDLTQEQVETDKRLSAALKKAIQHQIEIQE